LTYDSHVSSSLLTPILSYNHPPPTAIYTLSLHDALPISLKTNNKGEFFSLGVAPGKYNVALIKDGTEVFHFANVPVTLNEETNVDRKSTRLNSSHVAISYAVFCLKKKK